MFMKAATLSVCKKQATETYLVVICEGVEE